MGFPPWLERRASLREWMPSGCACWHPAGGAFPLVTVICKMWTCETQANKNLSASVTAPRLMSGPRPIAARSLKQTPRRWHHPAVSLPTGELILSTLPRRGFSFLFPCLYLIRLQLCLKLILIIDRVIRKCFVNVASMFLITGVIIRHSPNIRPKNNCLSPFY